MEMIEEEMEEDDGLEVAPGFSLETHDGQTLSSDIFADKVAVIFFFGNSCPPCKSVAPDIEAKINQEFKDDDNFVMLGIDQWDGNAASVERFKDDTGVTFPLGRMGSGVARDYGTTYDRLVLINSRGKIAFKGQSIAANDLDEVINQVKGLLN